MHSRSSWFGHYSTVSFCRTFDVLEGRKLLLAENSSLIVCFPKGIVHGALFCPHGSIGKMKDSFSGLILRGPIFYL
jgi:hypothetical protein